MSEFTKEDLINANQRFIVPNRNSAPKVDVLVSKIVGKNIMQNDSRLINLIVKWKQESGKPENSDDPDRYFDDPLKVDELKKVFS